MPVHAKLNKARLAFHAMPLKKSGHNTFAGYRYFELGDFLLPALQVFDDFGLCAWTSFSDAYATMHIVDTEDGSTIIITSPMGSASLKGCHEIQNIGACETYSTRYLWTAALCIVEHDALEATTGNAEPEYKPMSDEMFNALQGLIDATKTDAAALCTHYKVNSLRDLKPKDYKAAMAVLQKKAAKA